MHFDHKLGNTQAFLAGLCAGTMGPIAIGTILILPTTPMGVQWTLELVGLSCERPL